MSTISRAGMLIILALVMAACAEIAPRTAERDSLVLLKCRFQEPGYRNYECLQATPGTSPLTDVNGVARVKQERGTTFEVVNCPEREEVDADYVCEDWIESKGCKRQTMFYTSQPGEKIYLFDCDFSEIE